MKKALSHITFHAHRRQLPPLYDKGTEWYQGWYFDLRLEEEVSRAARYSLPLVVIAIQLGEHPRADDPEFQRLMRSVRGTRLRRSDIPAIRDEQELLICLTQTRSEQATTVVQRLRRAFTSYTPNIGMASFPEDGSHPAPFLPSRRTVRSPTVCFQRPYELSHRNDVECSSQTQAWMSEMFKNHRPISPTRLTLLLCGSACLQPLLLGISIEAFENALLFGAAAVSSQLTSSWTRRQMEEWKSRVEQRLRESLQRSRPAEDNLFSVTYFMVRLDQEVRRSLRYKLPLSVLVLQLATDSSEESALAAVVTGGARMLRAEDTFAFLGLGEFAFFLPHTDAPGAQIVAARLVKALQEFRPTAGVASISEGGAAAAKDPLAEARHAAARVETAKLWNEGQAVA